jgi:hypothetical protein
MLAAIRHKRGCLQKVRPTQVSAPESANDQTAGPISSYLVDRNRSGVGSNPNRYPVWS